MEVLTRRPRLYDRRSLKVNPRRSPKINIVKAIANSLTILCAIGCISLILYAIYLALPQIGYGIWLSLPCFVVAAIVGLIGASIQAFIQTRGNQ